MSSPSLEFDRDLEAATEVTFTALEQGRGVKIVDPIDRHQFELFTQDTVSLSTASPDRFMAPVDAATAIETTGISYPIVVAVYIRDRDGELLLETEHSIEESFPDDTYFVELAAPMKVYLRIEGEFSITADRQHTAFSFPDVTEVTVGARSHHEHPAGTITTTGDIEDLMTAVSLAGSALKTTSPERSYPTLRGHPPLIELGDELEVPPGLERPDTGIRIEIPEERRYVFEVAPLAYYLGAEVVPGTAPRIVTENGWIHHLGDGDRFQDDVERVLKQVFFLDCVTRTEGYYRVDLHEREAIEPKVDLDFGTLYDQPIATQLERYLSVPFDAISSHLPEWKLTTHVSPNPQSVELLPFALNELAVIRSQPQQSVETSMDQLEAVKGFTREGEMTRSASANVDADLDTVVKPETTDSLGETWVGDGAPIGATKASINAHLNRLDRTPTEGNISIAVVRNDPEMEEEQAVVDDVYSSRDHLPFEVSLYYDLTTAEMQDLLQSDHDFLHYIGHVDAEGIRCADGRLDVRDLDDVEIDAFLLNACQSYDQGMGLIDAGGIGGVVTLREVINSGAVEIGKSLARLLNRGFPLRAALNIAKGESIIGDQYIVVGDGELGIAQPESGTPIYANLIPGDDEIQLEMKTYPTTQKGMGSLIIPLIKDNQTHYLNSGTLEKFTLSREELEETLLLENMPVVIDGELYWTQELSYDYISNL